MLSSSSSSTLPDGPVKGIPSRSSLLPGRFRDKHNGSIQISLPHNRSVSCNGQRTSLTMVCKLLQFFICVHGRTPSLLSFLFHPTLLSYSSIPLFYPTLLSSSSVTLPVSAAVHDVDSNTNQHQGDHGNQPARLILFV